MIEDDGVGIPESIEHTLFDAFVRGDKSRNSSGGSGLGLCLSKAIVEKHGAKLRYEKIDKGARFIIEGI